MNELPIIDPSARDLSPGWKRQYTLTLNNPGVVPVEDAHHMRDDDVVVGISVNGRYRAYPWYVLSNYHVINDMMFDDAPPVRARRNAYIAPVDGVVPILVALCEACAGASVFAPVRAEAPDAPLIFAFAERNPSRYSAFGIYTVADIETQSRWHPLLGRAMDGPLGGIRLPRLPTHNFDWGEWRRRFPDTDVAIGSAELRTRPHVIDMPGPLDLDAAHSHTQKLLKTNPEMFDHRLKPGELMIGFSVAGQMYFCALDEIAARGGRVVVEADGAEFTLLSVGPYSAAAFRAPEGARLELDGNHIVGGGRWTLFGDPAEPDPRPGAEHAALEIPDDCYVSKWADWSFANPDAKPLAIIEGR